MKRAQDRRGHRSHRFGQERHARRADNRKHRDNNPEGVVGALLQFLIEAVALATLGGMLGIALGVGASALASRALTLPPVLRPDVLLYAVGFSGAIGVAFGYVPARKAARLRPIEALRHE
jgi:predicted lysophospholipase L1 biosynthesis ABC-type transport system permease subunit